MAAALICLPDLSYSPLQSPLKNDTFLFIIFPDSKNASFPVLLHQLITSWLEWKGCCIQGPKGDLLHAVSTANRILGLFSRKKGICYHRGNNFWKTVCEEMTHVLGSPQKSYLKWKTLQFEECSQWGLTAVVTPVAVLGSIRFPDHFGSCGKWIFSECTDIISNSSAIISDSCYELQHHFIPERGPPSIPSMPF